MVVIVGVVFFVIGFNIILVVIFCWWSCLVIIKWWFLLVIMIGFWKLIKDVFRFEIWFRVSLNNVFLFVIGKNCFG